MNKQQVVWNFIPLRVLPPERTLMRSQAMLVACLMMLTQAASGEEAATTPAPQPQAVQQPGTAGMTVYVDPNTGQFLSEPAPNHVPLVLSPQMQNALSTSHSGLFELANTAPGGGFKLDLQGRFQSPLIITIDADGNAKTQHLQEKARPESQTPAAEAAQSGAQ